LHYNYLYQFMKKLVVFFIAVSSLLGAKKMEAQVGVSITVAPPELLEYSQPACPTDGYLWSPGYWAYGSDGYYWVPGVWVECPQEGYLWTPGYWGFVNGGYFWNGGYWGPTVGFYGGVCYGYGYGGDGFYGGRWQGGHFQYNTAAWRVGGGIHNTYVDRTVIHNSGARTSFNGPGGVTRQPNEREQAAAKEDHHSISVAQQSHEQKAVANKNQRATANGGHPSTTAKSKVDGERFNSAGHSISTIHRATPQPASTVNHTVNASRPAVSHPANNVARSTPRPQPQQRSTTQSRPAAQQGAQRASQPARNAQGGGSHGGGGGGGHKH
jgi:hypothetical protein